MWRSLFGKIFYRFCLYKKGLYIKLGQILYLQFGIFSKEFRNELAGLQQHVPCDLTNEEYESYVNMIDKRITNVKLVNAGSVAVIFKGEYEKECVAIKMVKPNIKKQMLFQKDTLIWTLSYVVNHDDYYEKIYKIFDSLLLQTDMFREAKELEYFHNICKSVIIPKPYLNLCSDSMLVMEWIDGCDLMCIENCNDEDKKDYGSQFIMFVKDCYNVGRFHMDLHPGNILITKDKKISIIDFGITSHLDKNTIRQLLTVYHSFYEQNIDEFINAFRSTYTPGMTHELDLQIRERLENMSYDERMNTEFYIFVKELIDACDSHNVYINKSFGDFEFAISLTKSTFMELWNMKNEEFYLLIS